MSILLVDADIVAYKIAAVSETPIRWENEVWTLHSDETECQRLIVDYFDRLKEETQCTKIISAFSDKLNFRNEILPSYKENRKSQRKPLTLKFCKDYIYKNYNGYSKPKLEADDVLGILATTKILPGNKIICSEDKDLNQVEGLHYNPAHREFYKISKKQAEHNFYLQILVGDQSDNYKGCPTFGIVKAEKTLAGCKNYWTKIVESFESQGLTENDALQQARVARILKGSDYDLKIKSHTLWNPPKVKKLIGIKLSYAGDDGLEKTTTVFGTKL